MKRVFHRIDLRIFEIRNTDSACRVIRPARFTAFSAEQVPEIVAGVVEKVHAARPGYLFEAVQVGPAKYNIVWKGYT